MRSRILVSAGLLVVLFALVTLSAVVHPTQAQGTKPTVCDSTLITLTYLAEHDYGFHSSMDVAKFEKGQFKPWFDAMMAAMPGSTMQGTADAMMAATPAAMMQGTQEAGMMTTELKPGNVSGEDSACTALRAEVEGYLTKTIASGMMKK